MEGQKQDKYMIVKVSRDVDIFKQIGKHSYFDLVDHGKVHGFVVHKDITFHQFKENVAKEFGIPVRFQRFWFWANRENKTYRPSEPMTVLGEKQTVGQLLGGSLSELNLFLEVQLGEAMQPVVPPTKTGEDILLFFKLFDPIKQELWYVGRLFVKATGRPVEILKILNDMAGFGVHQEIQLFEEINFEPQLLCVAVDDKVTFRNSQLQDGDIICFQKTPQSGCQDIPSFFEHVLSHPNQFPQNHSTPLPSSVPTAMEERSDQSSCISETSALPQESNKSSSPFAEVDSFFTDIRNLLKETKIGEVQPSLSFSRPRNDSEIADAKNFFNQRLESPLSSIVIHPEETHQLKDSLSAMIANRIFPNYKALNTARQLLEKLHRSIEQYIAAQQCMKEAKEKEKLIGELKSSIRQLCDEFMPIRSQAEAVNQEIDELESQLIKRRSAKASLASRLEDLTSRAIASKQALAHAEQETKLIAFAKERSEQIVSDMDGNWESVKKLHPSLLH